MSWPWPLDHEFMRLAFAAGLVVGVVAPVIGVFLVQRRLSLLGEATGHVAFAGVAVGLAAGVAPTVTALLVAIAGAVIVDVLRRRGVAGDLVLAFVLYVGLATGVVVFSASDRFGGDVLDVLFGQILSVSAGEVVLIAALGAAVLAVLAVTGRALFAVVVDETSAAVAGLPVAALGTTLAVLAAVTVVIAMKAVGILLVAAMMVLPVGAASMVARSFRAMLAASAAIGAGSVIAGLTVAREANVVPSGAIVLAAAAAFVVTAVAGTRVRRLLREPKADQGLSGPDAHHAHPHVH